MVNLTLIVQMVHFAIAAWLLDRIVLRFVVQLVHREQGTLEQVQHLIADAQRNIAHNSAEKQQRWHTIQHKLLQQKPVSAVSCAKQVIPPVHPQQVAPQDVATLVEQLTTAMVERIVHD